MVWHLPTGESKSFKVSVPQVPAELLQTQCYSLSVYFCRTVDIFFTVESFLTGCPYYISSLLGSACFLRISGSYSCSLRLKEIIIQRQNPSYWLVYIRFIVEKWPMGVYCNKAHPQEFFSWKGPAQSAYKKRQKYLCMELSYRQTENVNPIFFIVVQTIWKTDLLGIHVQSLQCISLCMCNTKFCKMKKEIQKGPWKYKLLYHCAGNSLLLSSSNHTS